MKVALNYNIELAKSLQMWSKHTLRFLSVGALVLAATAVFPVSAEGPITKVPLSFTADNPCTPTQEQINFDGFLMFGGNVAIDGNGVQHFHSQANAVYQGIDQLTGEKYIAKDNFSSYSTFPDGTSVLNSNLRVISANSSSDFNVALRQVITPNTEPVIKLVFECKG